MMTAWRRLVEASKYQIYISRSLDPFLNLSIEHFLLQKSPPSSTVLFLYTNRPCVVIGRNQNPWLEVDLKSLRQRRAAAGLLTTFAPSSEFHDWWENTELVRRRSGGGTVFHDEGNVNYSVICPTADFTRDKHAEMVTKAIRTIDKRARVNERHDIVLDQGDLLPDEDRPSPVDMHRTCFHPNGKDRIPLKISGSAYKMTRQRSLHHGTCLLASADLYRISRLLASPARPFMKARGVESVRSPIGNIYATRDISNQNFNENFQYKVIEAFGTMYNIDQKALENGLWSRSAAYHDKNADCAVGQVGDELDNIEEIRAGIEELESPKWIYGQTPQFTLSSHPTEEDPRPRPPLPPEFPASVRLVPFSPSSSPSSPSPPSPPSPLFLPNSTRKTFTWPYISPQARVYLKIKSGIIISTSISLSPNEDTAKTEAEMFDATLKGRSIEDIADFSSILGECGYAGVDGVAMWLNVMFGKAVESPP